MNFTFRGKTLDFDIFAPPLCDTFDGMVQRWFDSNDKLKTSNVEKVSEVIRPNVDFLIEVFGEETLVKVFDGKPIGLLDCLDLISAMFDSVAEQKANIIEMGQVLVEKGKAALGTAAQE